jgi:hypothetical protein
VNEAQPHLMKIAASNPFLLVQLSPVPMHLKGRRDLETKREQAERDRRERIDLDSLWLQLGNLEFVDAEDLDSLWLQLGYLEFVDADDDSGRIRFRITPTGRAAYRNIRKGDDRAG